MLKKWKKITLVLTCVLAVFPLGKVALADDDDDDHEKHEYYQKEHHEDAADDETEWKSTNQEVITTQTDYWYIWSKQPRNTADHPLPIETPSELLVSVNNTEKRIYFIPQDGQLLVSAEVLGQLLGADTHYYPQSQICSINKGNQELIVKVGSNAAYENQQKTPMPVQAAAIENSIYIPISVVANALGYRVNWDGTKQLIFLQSI
ncbi:copper amine oxidase N-terminal domain-containing protein [Neobacillus sp. LXY-1]|uniref:copper amine oxidase N-terminal domain-containing protein n=1 Tax=Neobacillus sp. LXY-1 TaxID=3379133 RepID=UPI003EDF0373